MPRLGTLSRRITTDDIRQSMEKTGLPLVSNKWNTYEDGQLCGACALSQLVISELGEESYESILKGPYIVEKISTSILGSCTSFPYLKGFVRGFDAGEAPQPCEMLGGDDPSKYSEFIQGYKDGTLVRQDLL